MENASNYFEFIADAKFKNILVRDFNELQNCINAENAKSALILSGSIIEAILLEFFTHTLPSGKNEDQVLKMNLADLINEAEKISLISNKSKDLSTVIKNYRNLIHPGREIRTREEFDFETAIVSFSLLKMILKEIKENYIQKYGYKAEDIYHKIIIDTSTYSIYDKLLEKLNTYEKNKLMHMLVELQIEQSYNEEKINYTKYIDFLKNKLDKEQLISYCQSLLKQVEKGEKTHILVMFKLFGSNINLLNNTEQELIMTYIYNEINTISFWSGIPAENIKLFYLLGFNLNTAFLKQKYFELLLKLVNAHSYANDYHNKWGLRNAYREMISNLTKDKIKKCEEYIKENLEYTTYNDFYNGLEFDEDLPF